MRYDYEHAQCPEETDSLNEEFVGHDPFTNGYPGPDAGKGAYSGTNPLGDPVLFSAYLLGQIANNRQYATSFDLDADRAYGYLCWDWMRGAASGTNPRGQPYPLPLVWPEGANGPDGSWQPPPATPAGQEPGPQYMPPLQLRYLGRSCEEALPKPPAPRRRGAR